MTNTTHKIWDTVPTRQFVRVITSIGDEEAMEKFLRDVMTESEILEISNRLEAARLLAAGAKYAEVMDATKLSSRTVARISSWMRSGTGGYASVLKSL